MTNQQTRTLRIVKDTNTTIMMTTGNENPSRSNNMCPECDEELHRFEFDGTAGWGCDGCGWSWDDEEDTVTDAPQPHRKDAMKDILTVLVEKSVNLERFYRTHGGPGRGNVTLVVPLDDALKAVADMPRIYWGEELNDAPNGRYYTTYPGGSSNITPHGVDGLPKSFARTFACDPDAWFFGPLPTNEDKPRRD